MESAPRFEIRVRTRRGGRRHFTATTEQDARDRARELMQRQVVTTLDPSRGPQVIERVRVMRWMPEDRGDLGGDAVKVIAEWNVIQGRFVARSQEHLFRPPLLLVRRPAAELA